MKGKRLFISFQGAESGLALWLNGAFIGYSEDSFTPSEFELTDYLKDGQNKLAAQVFKWTSSSWCEDQDFFRFSGIYRDVYLYTVPDIHAYDLQIDVLHPSIHSTRNRKCQCTHTNSHRSTTLSSVSQKPRWESDKAVIPAVQSLAIISLPALFV